MEGQKRWYASEINFSHQIVADVGANVGNMSQFFWDAGNTTNSVISIEPLPQNIKRIRKRIARSKAARWRVEACAASDISGQCALRYFHSPKHGWNSLVVDDPGPADTRQTGFKDTVIECRTLSELVPDATIVKIDIEGHEYTVFDQALTRLSQVHTWAMELHMIPDRPLGSVIDQFTNCGFSLIAATQGSGGDWGSVHIDSSLHWNRIPAVKRLADGREFKMLHVIAKRRCS